MSYERALARIAREAESGYETFGTAHMMLRAWHREDWPAGPPQQGQLTRVVVEFPNGVSPDELGNIGGADRLGLALADDVARLIFNSAVATTHEASGGDVDQAVRIAIRSCLSIGTRAGVWTAFDDEPMLSPLVQLWDGVTTAPAHAYLGTWHRMPVFGTNFVPTGELWVVGDMGLRVLVYPDSEGAGRIATVFHSDRRPQRLEARLWIDLRGQNPRGLHRVVIVGTSTTP